MNIKTDAMFAWGGVLLFVMAGATMSSAAPLEDEVARHGLVIRCEEPLVTTQLDGDPSQGICMPGAPTALPRVDFAASTSVEHNCNPTSYFGIGGAVGDMETVMCLKIESTAQIGECMVTGGQPPDRTALCSVAYGHAATSFNWYGLQGVMETLNWRLRPYDCYPGDTASNSGTCDVPCSWSAIEGGCTYSFSSRTYIEVQEGHGSCLSDAVTVRARAFGTSPYTTESTGVTGCVDFPRFGEPGQRSVGLVPWDLLP